VGLSYAEWEARVPRLLAAAVERFGLREVREPFARGAGGFVAPVSDDAVLKLAFPHFEARRGPDALELLAGAGAPRLLARADDLWAMLLERLHPGTQLWELPEQRATPIAAEALRSFWRPLQEQHSFRPLAGEAARWAEQLAPRWERAGRPVPRALVEEAVELARELGATIGERVLLHQDLQGSNVLLSQRGWLAVDPKPLAGERAFDLASLLRDRRWELTEAVVRRRFEELTERLGLDRARVRGWGVVHALAWGLGENERELVAARWIAAQKPWRSVTRPSRVRNASVQGLSPRHAANGRARGTDPRPCPFRPAVSRA
jgi:streptomycin 6-kinase